MSDPLAPAPRGGLLRAVLVVALIMPGLPAGAADAEPCPAVTEGVALCVAGTEWEGQRIERFDDVTAWESEGYFVEFNPAMTAAAADGPAAAALDRLLGVLLQEEEAPDVTPLLRDAFQHADARSERVVYRIVEEGETYLGAVMLTDFPGHAAPRLAWSLGSFDPVSLDDILGVIDATAAGLRPATEN